MSLDSLEDDLLYVIVFGPGFGESIVVRVPPSTWIVVDGARFRDVSFSARLLERHRAAWSGVILTHPHSDHAPGLGAVLDGPGDGPIGCADLAVPDPGQWMNSADLGRVLNDGRVEHVAAAIQTRWEASESSRWILRQGERREIGDCLVTVLYPDEATAASHRDSGGDPNGIASALILSWEGVKILLGSDLLAAGWAGVTAMFPALNDHAALKVPHHGSRGAQHDCFGKGDRDRLWIVTPYSRGSKLPRFEDGGGIAWLLRRVDRVHLTGLPVAHLLQGKVPYRATRQGIRDGLRPRILRRALGAGLALARAAEPDEELGCYVAAGFRRDGTLGTLEHGAGALVVAEESRGTPPRRGPRTKRAGA